MSIDIDALIDSAIRDYPDLWKRVIAEWRQPEKEDAAWLTYSANYLLRTAGVHWALDPFSLVTRVGRGEQPDFMHDLDSLDLVVLSHAHNDHLDPVLLKAIATLPVTWVIPEFMLEMVKGICDTESERLIVPKPGEKLRIGALELTPFDGLHFNQGRGVPEMGYLAEFNGKRWLFPGDTRSYMPDRLPDFRPLDGFVAHLWLGKGSALLEPPPLMEDFISFCSWQEPGRIVITHLEELGRSEDELWTPAHAEKVRGAFSKIHPDLPVSIVKTGQRFSLS
jgi:hypothetical protein